MKTPRIESLISSLRPLVAQRGAKASLARHIGQPWSSVWQYVRGTRKPSGEVALAIQDWILCQNSVKTFQKGV